MDKFELKVGQVYKDHAGQLALIIKDAKAFKILWLDGFIVSTFDPMVWAIDWELVGTMGKVKS